MKPGQWGWSFDHLVEAWRLAEEAGFDVLGCFDHASSAPEPAVPAWDAPTLLAAMAAHTRRIQLAVQVLNASLRHPFLLAAQLAVAQAASGGRVQVGIGAGSHYFARFDHEAIGVPFPSFSERMRRLETLCRVLPSLLRGERVSGPDIGLREASLGPIEIRVPPIFVGGSSERALDIALRHADGWHAPSDVDPKRFAAIAVSLDEKCDAVPRPRLRKAIQLRAPDPRQAPKLLGDYGNAGADLVVFVLGTEQGPNDVQHLADALR